MSPAQHPNIILINCDDLGYGDLGCYGSGRNTTPHLDRLAANGMRFTDFYMASPVCSASRAALLTGCYPQRVGFGPNSVLFPGQDVGLSTRETTIAGQLKKAGYATKIVGKWHCGDQPEFLPTRHGFDEYFGIPFSNDMGRQSNNPNRPPLPLLRNETVIQEQPDQRGITERYTDESLQFIENHGGKRGDGKPFFLYLAHMYVHVPLFVPKQFLEGSENGAYGGAVAAIDWSTGMIMDRLKQLGLLENTLIIFTSDNGSRARDEGGSNLPCRGAKATTWEGGQRVPCIMHWPDQIKPGSECTGIARSFDLLPTLSSIAGVPLSNASIDGEDLSAVINGDTTDTPAETFYYYQGQNLDAIRVGDWKLHFHKSGWMDQGPCSALYNLRDDVSETTDLRERHPDMVARLEAEAEKARTAFGDGLQDREGAEIRPIGRVSNAKPLTEYREDHPYIVAMYDLPDMKTMSG